MNPWLVRLVYLGIAAWVGKELFSSSSNKTLRITKSSNCDSKFRRFNDDCNLDDHKINSLRKAHSTIREKIKSYLYSTTPLPSIKFFIQGSYKTKTVVENTRNECDVDLALIFTGKPNLSIKTIQNHIKKALDYHTTQGVIIKSNCVRLNYVRGFHIDIPIYYEDRKGNLFFGSQNNGWVKSNPKAFVNWFKQKTKGKPQLVRMIRYLKAWADSANSKTQRKMPSGLALTLWAVDNYVKSDRDDVAFFKTSINILEYLKNNYETNWAANMVVEPFDNVLNRLNSDQKSNFYVEFSSMVSNAVDALSSKNINEAGKEWKKVFGKRFK